MQQGRYGFAPLQNPEFAADVAGGTGVWAFEFGEYSLAVPLSPALFVLA